LNPESDSVVHPGLQVDAVRTTGRHFKFDSDSESESDSARESL
jgi:hypothetical protein